MSLSEFNHIIEYMASVRTIEADEITIHASKLSEVDLELDDSSLEASKDEEDRVDVDLDDLCQELRTQRHSFFY